jgi:hypothetical protein
MTIHIVIPAEELGSNIKKIPASAGMTKKERSRGRERSVMV